MKKALVVLVFLFLVSCNQSNDLIKTLENLNQQYSGEQDFCPFKKRFGDFFFFFHA